jgi:signal transduction histidine kinase
VLFVAQISRDNTKRYEKVNQSISEQFQISNDLLERITVENRQLIETTNLRSKFLANMSHELRTPLACVIGIAGLLADTQLDDQQKEYNNMIRTSGELLLHIINNILDLSKLEGKQISS